MRKYIITALVFLTTFTINAQHPHKSVTWENICSHQADLPLLGHIVPVHSSLDRASYWSVGCETLDRDYAEFDNFISYMGETGVGYSRLQSGWAKTEKQKGVYDFAWIDHQVDGLLKQGIHPWICLCYGNNIYAKTGDNLNARIFPDGPVMDGWLAYVRQVVKRYKGKVTMYEVWNEPNGASAINGREGESWREYSNMFARTARVIRDEDPDAKIAALGAFCSGKCEYFHDALKEIERLGAAKYMDYVTYHGYEQIPESIIQPINLIKDFCHEVNPETKLLQGESGCPAQLEYGHAMCHIEWTEYSQAKWNLRHTLINFVYGIPSSIFTMVDLNYGWMLQSFGLIRMNGHSEPQYIRPLFHAVQHLTSTVTTDFIADNSVKVTTADTANQIFVRGIKKVNNPDADGFMIWLSGKRPDNSLIRENHTISLSGIELEDPVYVDLLTGTVNEVKDRMVFSDGTLTIKNLPIWDSPVLIMERNCVNFK